PTGHTPPADCGWPTRVPRCPGSASGPHPGTGRDRRGAPRVPPGDPNLGPGVAFVSPRPRCLPRPGSLLRLPGHLPRPRLSSDRQSGHGPGVGDRDAIRAGRGGRDPSGDGPFPLAERRGQELAGPGRTLPIVSRPRDPERPRPPQVRAAPDCGGSPETARPSDG